MSRRWPYSAPKVSRAWRNRSSNIFRASRGFHEAAGVTFNGVKIPHLIPGEKLNIYGSQHPNQNFAEFEKAFHRKFASGTGTPITALTSNYEDVNYSSARAQLADIWRCFLVRRSLLVNNLGMPFVAAWLEEGTNTNRLPLPDGVTDFYRFKEALCRGRFIMWGKPLIDPVKERNGQKIGWELGVETLEDICATEGKDWEDQLEQKAREKQRMEELGLNAGDMHPDPKTMNESRENETDLGEDTRA